MSWEIMLPVGAILAACWGVVSSVVMTARIQSRGEKVSFVFFRLMMPKYVSRYREMTVSRQGSPDTLYYSFIVAMNLALLLFAAWILLRLVQA